jgi:Flavin containing amine oxidoreductase
MRRRDLLLAAGAAVGGAGLFYAQQGMPANVDYPGREFGHWLRDAGAQEAPTQSIETEVLIAGSGVAGLTGAWQLKKLGVKDVLMVNGPERYGNAAAGSAGELRFPTGAHYLPLPSMESTHVREMLADFGILEGDPYAREPRFDERCLVHGPAERVLYRGRWQEGYLPAEGVSAAERSEHQRFFKQVERWAGARGADGRRAFVVPVALSSSDAGFRALDRLSFRDWLKAERYISPTLHWYLNYCCRDDYGREYHEISAWAGLHYFCSRDGQAANAERGAVLTWPGGLAALADRLDAAGGTAATALEGSVTRLMVMADGVEAWVRSGPASAPRVLRVRARHAIAAMPLYVLRHVLTGGADPLQAADLPQYAPWVISNFILKAFPEEQPGVPLAWDNVVYQERGLGYVVSTHQDFRLDRPARTAFTAYHALSHLSPEAGRGWLQGASVRDLTQVARQDLDLAYGWRLPLCVEQVAVTVRGHAMAVPGIGFLRAARRDALRASPGPLYVAHADLSGLSVFEEAAWWGYQAAQRIAAART